MSVAHEVAQILENENFGKLWDSTSWYIAVGEEPEKPDQSITVYDTPGREPHYADKVEHPSVQIRVRGSAGDGYLLAATKISQIKHKLVFNGTFVLSGVDFVFWAEGGEFWLMNDENRRPIFVLNLRIQRSE